MKGVEESLGNLESLGSVRELRELRELRENRLDSFTIIDFQQ